MKAKSLIIWAIICALLTLALAWISSSNQFDFKLPWAIVSAPSILFVVVILLPYAVREDKKKKEEAEKKDDK